MTQHTPGPWYVDPPGSCMNSMTLISSPEHGTIAQVVGSTVWDREERGANARLIAAAPDLLGIVRSLVLFTHMERHNKIKRAGQPDLMSVEEYMDGIDLDAARAAIAKAEGK